MSTSNQIEFIDVNDLSLDLENPRLPDSFNPSNRSERAIINWMLEDASLIELISAIYENGFFIGEALLVVKEEGRNVVIEGNRRLASVKVLNHPDIVEIHERKIEEILSDVKEIPEKIPCIIFDRRSDIEQYLGYRHVTGVKTWGVLAKARYLKRLSQNIQYEDMRYLSKELAKKIGSRSDYVRNLLCAYETYLVVRDEKFFKIRGLDETTIHFNYFVDSLRRENIRDFIKVDTYSSTPVSRVDIKNLEILMRWFFEKNQFNITMVKGDSSSLSTLDQVLSNEKAKECMLQTNSLDEASFYLYQTADTFSLDLKSSLRVLQRAHGYIHKIEDHNSYDMDNLKEIFELCKLMRDAIKNKEADEEF